MNVINPFIYSKGIPDDYILAMDFNGDLTDKSVNNNNGIGSGSYSFGVVTDSDGISQNCVTTTNSVINTSKALPMGGSDKVTISFRIKATTPSVEWIMALGNTYGGGNGYNVLVEAGERLIINDVGSPANGMNYPFIDNSPIVFNNKWHTVSITIDRSITGEPNYETSIFLNGVKQTTSFWANYWSFDQVGGYPDLILSIANRHQGDFPFVGSLAKLRVYNRVLTDTEIKTLADEK